MEICSYTIKTKATPEQIWKVWEDVDNWKTWDREIEFSRIDGPFRTGTMGQTKFMTSPVFKTRLKQVEPLKLVVQEAYLFCAKIVSHQIMKQVDGETEVTFRIDIEGPLSFLYVCTSGRFIRKKVPLEMEEMIKVVSMQSAAR